MAMAEVPVGTRSRYGPSRCGGQPPGSGAAGRTCGRPVRSGIDPAPGRARRLAMSKFNHPGSILPQFNDMGDDDDRTGGPLPFSEVEVRGTAFMETIGRRQDRIGRLVEFRDELRGRQSTDFFDDDARSLLVEINRAISQLRGDVEEAEDGADLPFDDNRRRRLRSRRSSRAAVARRRRPPTASKRRTMRRWTKSTRTTTMPPRRTTTAADAGAASPRNGGVDSGERRGQTVLPPLAAGCRPCRTASPNAFATSPPRTGRHW